MVITKREDIHSIFASKFLITKVTIMEFKKGGGYRFLLGRKGGATDFSFSKRGGATDFSIFRSTFP